jgi:2-keto-4-pentenoate hydratase/2-oxohepta-3-ene-1,7-dioic acid hydratase in catechol pathway
MKLVRFGALGAETPGIVDADGNIRDLSSVIPDLTPDQLGPDGLAALRGIDVSTLPVAPEDARLGAPMAGIRQYLGVGLNYHDHAAEANLPSPDSPILFSKWLGCICGPNDNTIRPAGSVKMDYEVELGVMIGKRAKNVSVENALDHVLGYALCNDVSEREQQLELGSGQWGKGKGFDTFGPIGPWLVTADEIPDPQNLDIWLEVNGERRQDANTRLMIFSVAQIISACSHVTTLEAGDFIATGTPAGVGVGFTPPKFLNDGDSVRLGITGLGVQEQTVQKGEPQ